MIPPAPLNKTVRPILRPTAWIALAAAVLLPAALLTNLGLVALYGDEGIRALVALEMDISGNWITPTLFGEFYYNKPPLYNWILALCFRLTGRTDEFAVRLPTVLFLLAFAATLRFFLRRQPPFHSDPVLPVAIPLMLLTTGRILFWDSMLGLLDICYAWVLYSLFMVIYTEGERQRDQRLFPIAYLLGAVAFLLKGLPALYTLGVSLPAYFFWRRQPYRLVSRAHLGGILLFLAVIGSYYTAYAQFNGIGEAWKTLYHESAKRTFLSHGLRETILHVLSFPFEMAYHFLPWSLLLLPACHPRMIRQYKKHPFLSWNLLLLAVTILPFWLSVEVYPRYVFPQLPLLLTVLGYGYRTAVKGGYQLPVRIVEGTFLAGSIAATVALAILPATDTFRLVPLATWKSALLASVLLCAGFLYLRFPPWRPVVFALMLLVARLGFDWFVLPTRLSAECSTNVRSSSLRVADRLKGKTMYIYQSSLGFQPVTGYYLTRRTHAILHRKSTDFEPDSYCLRDPLSYGPGDLPAVDTLTIQWNCQSLLVVPCPDDDLAQPGSPPQETNR
ncbi:MAG: hypothetical protein RLY31_2181 [Bacteroidota bacterium]|jgi:4-amino-4-deoxy-L-arabinose transferase-like glycosyltransferase